MARMLIVLFVVLFVGVGSAQGQIVNVNDSDPASLARVRVLMDQPAGSGSMLFGSGSVLTLEPERFAVAQSGSGSSGGGWWSSGSTWIGITMIAVGGLGLYAAWDQYQGDLRGDPNEQANPDRPSNGEQAIYYSLMAGGMVVMF